MKMVNVELIAEKTENKRALIAFKKLVKLLESKGEIISIQWAPNDKPCG